MSVPEAHVYLAEGFEPSTLKVAQLRSILLQHNRSFPSSVRKQDLVDAFNTYILPERNNLLATSQRPVRSSSRGIVDVPTPSIGSVDEEPALGLKARKSIPDLKARKSIPDLKAEKKRGRKSTAVTVTLPDEADREDEAEVEAPAVKGRRSSRRSSIIPSSPTQLEMPVKTSRPRASKVAERVLEDSEPEDDEPPKRPSVAFAPLEQPKHRDELEEGNFSDFNAFQSGGSSPDVKSRDKKIRRKSSLGISSTTAPARRRKSEMIPSSYSQAETSYAPVPAQPSFEPSEVSPTLHKQPSTESITRTSMRIRAKARQSLPANLLASSFMPAADQIQKPVKEWRDSNAATEVTGSVRKPRQREDTYIIERKEDEPRTEEEQRMEESNAGYVAQNQVISKKLSSLIPSPPSTPSSSSQEKQEAVQTTEAPSSALVRQSRSSPSTSLISAQPVKTFSSLALLLSMLLFLLQWTTESSSIGYCDSASSTNRILQARQQAIDSARACVQRTITNGDEYGGIEGCDASALPMVPFLPRPTECTPCPAHAVCEQGQVMTCDREYLLQPSALEPFAEVLNGLPGLGSVAFPARCVPDTQKRRNVGYLARALEAELAKEKGEFVCEAGRAGEDNILLYGEPEEVLRERFLNRRDPSFSPEQFFEIFNAALTDLLAHNDAVAEIDAEGNRRIAAVRSEMTIACRAKLSAKDKLDAWKSQLGGKPCMAAVLAALVYARSQLKTSSEENKRVKSLVQIVLNNLREQERLHYLDPVQAPQVTIPVAHLRDDILASELSPASRQRLWSKVEKIVEGNANVRAGEDEVNGEVWRVWQWVGLVGALSSS